MSNPVRVFSKLPVCFSIASYRHSLSRLRLASRADRAVHSFSRLGLPRLRPAHRNPSLTLASVLPVETSTRWWYQSKIALRSRICCSLLDSGITCHAQIFWSELDTNFYTVQ